MTLHCHTRGMGSMLYTQSACYDYMAREGDVDSVQCVTGMQKVDLCGSGCWSHLIQLHLD